MGTLTARPSLDRLMQLIRRGFEIEAITSTDTSVLVKLGGDEGSLTLRLDQTAARKILAEHVPSTPRTVRG